MGQSAGEAKAWGKIHLISCFQQRVQGGKTQTSLHKVFTRLPAFTGGYCETSLVCAEPTGHLEMGSRRAGGVSWPTPSSLRA